MNYLNLIRYKNIIILILTQILVFQLIKKHSSFELNFNLNFWLLVLGVNSITAAGYVINDYFDIKIDLINKPEKRIVDKSISSKTTVYIYIFLNIIGLASSFYLKAKVFWIFFVVIILLFWYSACLKRQFFAGNFLVAFLSSLSIFIIWIQYSCEDAFTLVLFYCIFAFVSNLAREIVKDLEDLEGDSRYNCTTLPIKIGIHKSKTIVFCLIIAIISIVIFFSIINKNIFFKFYLMFLINAILVVFILKLKTSETPRDFNFLSKLLKIIMLLGVCSILVLLILDI